MCSYRCSVIHSPASLTHSLPGLLAHLRVFPPCVRKTRNARVTLNPLPLGKPFGCQTAHCSPFPHLGTYWRGHRSMFRCVTGTSIQTPSTLHARHVIMQPVRQPARFQIVPRGCRSTLRCAIAISIRTSTCPMHAACHLFMQVFWHPLAH